MANDVVRIAGQNFYSDELYHYGRLGQKWGRHIFGKIGSKSSKKSSKDKKPEDMTVRQLDSKIKKYEKVKKYKEAKSEITESPSTKKPKRMTDAQLDKAIARLEKEQRYKELTTATTPVSKVQKNDSFGQKFAKKMGDAAIDAVSTAAKNAGQQYLEKKFKNALGLSEQKDNLKEMSAQIKKWNTEDTYKRMVAERSNK